MDGISLTAAISGNFFSYSPKDRRRYLYWLYQARKRYGLTILNYKDSSFVKNLKALLGFKANCREVLEGIGGYQLRESASRYKALFEAENDNIAMENTRLWDNKPCLQAGSGVRHRAQDRAGGRGGGARRALCVQRIVGIPMPFHDRKGLYGLQVLRITGLVLFRLRPGRR